jgi:hypothetical protein
MGWRSERSVEIQLSVRRGTLTYPLTTLDVLETKIAVGNNSSQFLVIARTQLTDCRKRLQVAHQHALPVANYPVW